jgi:hypothetical protein
LGKLKSYCEAKEADSQEDKPQAHRQLPSSHAVYLNGTHVTHHKNRLGLRLRREIFYQADGGSLPMAILQFQNCLLSHLSRSSMKELTQIKQLSRPPRPRNFMYLRSPA